MAAAPTGGGEGAPAAKRPRRGEGLVPGKDFTGVGVGAWVRDRAGRILMIRRSATSRLDPGAWSRPGGAVEYGESCEEAVVRELQEETGLRICNPRLFDCSSCPGATSHWVSVGFMAELADGCAPEDAVNREPDKHDELGWFPLSALPDPIATFCLPGVERLREEAKQAAGNGSATR
eukprot:TRINITY_DN43742_c0_g1_i1.p2 TRINITY_DN43742_c0_g1~~TRINITY_DN43742_c0_g1_i1.p2  ORF type:complete len:199 (+),score=36.74 TRINITY_DN43742_c0_g1_i1:69-599(+)